MSSPPRRTRPCVGGCRPVITLNSVVLPAPFRPISPFTAPAWTSRLTLWSACSPPNRTEISSTASSDNRTHLCPDRRGRAGGCGRGERGHRGIELVEDGRPPSPSPVPEIGDLVIEPADAVGVAADGHHPEADEQLGEVGDLWYVGADHGPDGQEDAGQDRTGEEVHPREGQAHEDGD